MSTLMLLLEPVFLRLEYESTTITNKCIFKDMMRWGTAGAKKQRQIC